MWWIVAAFASGTASPKPAFPPEVLFEAASTSDPVRPPSAGDRIHPAQARLLVDHAPVTPGSKIRVGVLLEQETEWHTYWKSPGDIGLPTKIEWKLPDGATAEPFEFPIPQRFELQSIISYGYEDQVMFWSTIQLPEQLPSNTIQLGAKVSWLVCEVNCIPGEAELRLNVPVGIAKVSPSIALFDHYAAQHPVANSELSFKETSNVASLKSDQEFKFALDIHRLDGQPLPKPSNGGNWPMFIPMVPPDIALYSAKLTGQPDGSWRVEFEGQALAGEIQPLTSAIGGLFRFEKDGHPVYIELTKEIPWVAASSAETVSPPISVIQAVPVEESQVSTILMLGFALVGGLLLNVMPCVLPVLTLKLYGLVDEASLAPKQRQTAGLAYTAGILISFLVLAVVVIVLKRTIGGIGWGFQFQYPEYVAGLGAIVFAFGLSMFGVFEIPLIGANTISKATAHEGLMGHFLTGVFAVLLGTPCSAPFLGPAIGFAFSQSSAMIILFFLTVGLGLALPFLLVTWFPILFRLLPRPGAWMETFKHIMGFTLIATTVWLVDVFGTQTSAFGMTSYLAFLVVVATACWLFGRYGGIGRELWRQWSMAVIGLVAISGGWWALLDFQPTPDVACAAEVQLEQLDFSKEIPWQPFSEQAIAATAGIKPVFIDFTASWCLTCKVNERTILETELIRDAMKSHGIVPLKADWTKRDPVITQWLERYGRAGVPFYLVLPADRTQPAIPLPELLTSSRVTEALIAATSPKKSLD